MGLVSYTKKIGAMTVPQISEIATINQNTLRAWITRGLRTQDGRRVKLVASRYGGRWQVEPADLDRFLVELNSEAKPVLQEAGK